MPTYTFTTLNDPLGTFSTGAAGINDVSYVELGAGLHGFLYSGGIYTTLDDPQGTKTIGLGINNAGQIVGYYIGNNLDHGFLFSGGIYTTLDDPLGTKGTMA